MAAFGLILLVWQLAIGQGGTAAELRCLPDQDGFLSMRLRGNIEAEVRWREPELVCTGMSRPDGRGLRVRFAARMSDGGELAVVFAAPDLAMGSSGRSVPVNLTLVDSASERIYGTQGDRRCSFDEVEQRALADQRLPPRSYRISARGYCIGPARAIDGEGSVLLTRFDFAGLVTFEADNVPVDAGTRDVSHEESLGRLPQSRVEVATRAGKHRFDVWIAADEESRGRGLMHVRELPSDRGMLFVFEQPRPVSFWMKDTYISLDLIFIGADGKVVGIAPHATPLSLEPIRSSAPVTQVLEVVAGTAARIGLKVGDRVEFLESGGPNPSLLLRSRNISSSRGVAQAPSHSF